jgi:hypothetical protein
MNKKGDNPFKDIILNNKNQCKDLKVQEPKRPSYPFNITFYNPIKGGDLLVFPNLSSINAIGPIVLVSQDNSRKRYSPLSHPEIPGQTVF